MCCVPGGAVDLLFRFVKIAIRRSTLAHVFQAGLQAPFAFDTIEANCAFTETRLHHQWPDRDVTIRALTT